MTPKEKAQKIYNKIYGQTPTRWTEVEIEEDKRFSKQCALIAVDEIISSNPLNPIYTSTMTQIEYWEQVKREIEKL